MSDVVFIAGYYRSGTSALAGALSRLGVNLHNDAEANEHNPLGFYEIPELIELDVNIFSHLGVDWTDVRGLAEGWWDRADMARFLSRLDESLRRRFSNEPLWGLKHPHLCRLFPLYERAVVQAGHKPHVIHICRTPWTVAASQQRKNGLSRAHALLLWLTYLVSAERHARHLPRSWLTYHDLLADPVSVLRRVEGELGLSFSGKVAGGLAEARKFVTGQLNRSEPLDQKGLFRPLERLVGQVWDAVQARDHDAVTWDAFRAATADMVAFLVEVGESGGPAIRGFGANPVAMPEENPAQTGLRPLERLDDAAKSRLLALREAAPALPGVHVLLAVPPNRAHSIHATLESIRAQWHAPARVTIISADPLDIPAHEIVMVPEAAGALTAALCARTNEAAGAADYVAMINAGDVLSPDAILRFALQAGQSRADLLYCDEIVQQDNRSWVRHKPAWDATRLRQAAYLGDWVWYRGETIRRLGGFDAEFAGAEEYDLQLRFSEAGASVVRLPEALFIRAPLSRRDNIPSTHFGARAEGAVAAHLARLGIAGAVMPRQHLGLFRLAGTPPDPGTAVILLCGGAEVPMLDRWLKELLSGPVRSGPIILAGTGLTPSVETYLTQVHLQRAALEDKVLAVPPAHSPTEAAALRLALALAATEHVAIIDTRALPATPDWAELLRLCLVAPGVALASGRTLVAMAGGAGRFLVQGPIVIGADTRLGAGHMATDPGPGGWLAVDQQVSAVAPPILLACRAALAACEIPELTGDALWIDLCAQIRAAGGAIVWTPDVSFVAPADLVQVDGACWFRTGSPAARALPWEDPYHHPALSIHGDLLAGEQRFGLLRASPEDPQSVLLSGSPDTGLALLNAARAARATGALEAGWAPETLSAAELGRRAPAAWVRINPETPAAAGAPDYCAVFTRAPKPEMRPAISQAAALFGTSPALVQALRKLCSPRQTVNLWRPALSRPVWADLTIGTGMNTKPRVLWIDEGMAPAWLTELMNQTLDSIAWIVVERPGMNYAGSIARIRAPEIEQGWARELSVLAPHIMLRPADTQAEADHYPALMAAACACHILADERLDMPAALGATLLPNRLHAWQRALQAAMDDLKTTLERGQRARAAALAMPALETLPPPWLLSPGQGCAPARAAE